MSSQPWPPRNGVIDNVIMAGVVCSQSAIMASPDSERIL